MNTEDLHAAVACLREAGQAIDDPERLPATVLNPAMLHQMEYGEGKGIDQFVEARIAQAEALIRESLASVEGDASIIDAALVELLELVRDVDQSDDFTDPTLKQVAELVCAIHAALAGGGALPTAWRNTPSREAVPS